MSNPSWLAVARRYDGLREIPGAQTAPTIARWLAQLGAWWRDDTTPWCGTAMAAVFTEAGIKPPAAWYRAKAWATWGQPLPGPVAGAVAVLDRAGGGHVGLVVGVAASNRIVLLGGNQNDCFCEAAFDPARVIAYRWPEGEPVGPSAAWLAMAATPASSRSEA